MPPAPQRLKHARAPRLAATLQSIFGGQGRAGATTGLSGASLSRQLREQRIPPLGADTLRRAETTAQFAEGIPGAVQGDVQIVPDETTNSLLVRAQPADFEVVRKAVETMDLRPLQVLIEVLIAEVRRTRDLDIGISAKATRSAGGNTTSATLTPATGSTSDFVVKLTRGGSISVEVALSALATRGDVRILSRPLIHAQNNLEAKILVGSQRPFVQVFRSLPTDAAVRDQVVQYRDVGTSLTILPTINPDGYVNMQVAQEVSSATSETQFGAPVISTREASTHLIVRDGQTAVLGGLVDRQLEHTRSGIPLLSELPLIGAIFGGTRRATVNSELFLFLTPHIIAQDADVDDIRQQIEERRSGVAPALEQNPNVVGSDSPRRQTAPGVPAVPPSSPPGRPR